MELTEAIKLILDEYLDAEEADFESYDKPPKGHIYLALKRLENFQTALKVSEDSLNEQRD